MKKSFFVFVIILICALSLSFYYLSKRNNSGLESSNEIVLQFITYNGYGNNLYIDNVLTGVQKDNDVTVTSIVNIPYDTIYATSLKGTDTISPVVTVSNIGRSGTLGSGVMVTLMIEPGNYFDTLTIQTSLATGATAAVQFSPFTYTIGTGYYLTAYVTYGADTNRANDTLRQYSMSLPGYTRNVMYEEFTSNSSPACANNNPSLNLFLNSGTENLNSIVYHTGLLGLDSFYSQNPAQQDARMRYYYVSSVPTTYADGKLPVLIPYGDSNNVYSPYFKRLSAGTPILMSDTDVNVSGTSIQTTVNVTISSHLPPGDYRLRINAVEKYINADTLVVGTNGESQFFNIFRMCYPDTNGISIPLEAGNYQFQYTYDIQPGWADSMIYTCAFIQNDNTREIMNSASGIRIIPTAKIIVPQEIVYRNSDRLNVNYTYRNSYSNNVSADSIQTTLNVELFESYFPPLGWKIFNQDGFITFRQFTGANGPTIGGNKSVLMDFFDYNIPGQRDSMYSKKYTSLLDVDTVRFDYAYAQYTTIGSNIDSLIVKISSDGGLTFPVEIFRKGGFALSTAPQTTSFFIPANNSQWLSYKFGLGGIVSVNSNGFTIPSKFTLNQNYPNPFNPVTKIRYELPVSGTVKLKVFDILGKEIQMLVNQKQDFGVHEIDFNASGLPSGIYFYQLNTEGFSETKRMVLIK